MIYIRELDVVSMSSGAYIALTSRCVSEDLKEGSA